VRAYMALAVPPNAQPAIRSPVTRAKEKPCYDSA